jgi:hypothetical protein
VREDEESTQQKITQEADNGRNDVAEYRCNARGDEANCQAVIYEPHEQDAA